MKCNEVELGDFLFVCHEKTVLRPFDILWLSRLCVEPLVWKTENGLKFPLKISSSVPDIPAEPGFWLKKPHGKTHQQKVVVKNFPEYFHITIITSHESGGVPKVLYPRFFFFWGFVLGAQNAAPVVSRSSKWRSPTPFTSKVQVWYLYHGPGWSVPPRCRVQRDSF